MLNPQSHTYVCTGKPGWHMYKQTSWYDKCHHSLYGYSVCHIITSTFIARVTTKTVTTNSSTHKSKSLACMTDNTRYCVAVMAGHNGGFAPVDCSVSLCCSGQAREGSGGSSNKSHHSRLISIMNSRKPMGPCALIHPLRCGRSVYIIVAPGRTWFHRVIMARWRLKARHNHALWSFVALETELCN